MLLVTLLVSLKKKWRRQWPERQFRKSFSIHWRMATNKAIRKCLIPMKTLSNATLLRKRVSTCHRRITKVVTGILRTGWGISRGQSWRWILRVRILMWRPRVRLRCRFCRLMWTSGVTKLWRRTQELHLWSTFRIRRWSHEWAKLLKKLRWRVFCKTRLLLWVWHMHRLMARGSPALNIRRRTRIQFSSTMMNLARMASIKEQILCSKTPCTWIKTVRWREFWPRTHFTKSGAL